MGYLTADMLSFLQVNSKKPIYDYKNNQKAMEIFFATRLSKFITKFGKAKAHELIKIREEYFEKQK